MSDLDDFIDDTDDDDGEPNHIRALRNEAKEAKRLRKENADLQAKFRQRERDDAFRAAGIDPADPKQSYFVKGYDGDTTVEAIQEAARTAGFLDAPAPEAPTAEQTAGWVEAARVTSGAIPTPAPGLASAIEAELAAIKIGGDPKDLAHQVANILERHGQPVSRHGVFVE